MSRRRELPGELRQAGGAFKTRGSSGKVNIALDGPPRFTALPEGAPMLKGDLHFTDSIERMERAYDDWKAGHFSRDPFQDMMIPTMIDPTMTPPGKHFMSCFVQYAPPKIAGRDWTDADRDAFGKTVIDQIEAYAPGFRNLILHVEVRTPRELEAEVGSDRRQYLPGRADLRSAALQPPGAGLCAVSQPDPRPLDLRVLDPSGRRRDGRAGAQCRGRDPARDRDAPATMSDAYAVL